MPDRLPWSLVAAIVVIIALRHDPYHILYTDLHSEDSTAIAKKLSEKNIPYHISEGSNHHFRSRKPSG